MGEPGRGDQPPVDIGHLMVARFQVAAGQPGEGREDPAQAAAHEVAERAGTAVHIGPPADSFESDRVEADIFTGFRYADPDGTVASYDWEVELPDQELVLTGATATTSIPAVPVDTVRVHT